MIRRWFNLMKRKGARAGMLVEDGRYRLTRFLTREGDSETWEAFDKEERKYTELVIDSDDKIHSTKSISSSNSKRSIRKTFLGFIIIVSLLLVVLVISSLPGMTPRSRDLITRPNTAYHLAIVPELYRGNKEYKDGMYLAALIEYSLSSRTDIDVVNWYRTKQYISPAPELGKMWASSITYKEMAKQFGVRYLLLLPLAGDDESGDVPFEIIDLEEDRKIKSGVVQGANLLEAALLVSREVSAKFPCKEPLDFSLKLPPVSGTETWKLYVDGYYLLLSERPAQALEYLSKVVEVDPDFMEAHRIFAEASFFAGERDIALKVFRKVYKQSEKMPRLEKLWAEADYQFLVREKANDGRKVLRQLLIRYPDQKQAYIYELLWSVGRQELFDFERRMDSILKIDRFSPAGNRLAAIYNFKTAQWGRARGHTSEYMKSSGMNSESLSIYAELLASANEDPSAASYLSLALESFERPDSFSGGSAYFYADLPETKKVWKPGWANKIGSVRRSKADILMILAWMAAQQGDIPAFEQLSNAALSTSGLIVEKELYCRIYRSIVFYYYGLKNKLISDWDVFIEKYEKKNVLYSGLGLFYREFYRSLFDSKSSPAKALDRLQSYRDNAVSSLDKKVIEIAYYWLKLRYCFLNKEWDEGDELHQRLYRASRIYQTPFLPPVERIMADAALVRMESQQLWPRILVYCSANLKYAVKPSPVMSPKHLFENFPHHEVQKWRALFETSDDDAIVEYFETLGDEPKQERYAYLFNPRNLLPMADYYYSKEKFEKAAELYFDFVRYWRWADKDLPEWKKANDRLVEINLKFRD